MLFDTSCFQKLLLAQVHIAKMFCFSKFWAPSFVHCVFDHLRTVVEENEKHREIEITFLGPLGPL